jgi:hypothetical protein
MDLSAIALFVVATGAVAAGVFSFLSWQLQRQNAQENRQYKERLRLEEHYFKLHLVWQELRIAAVLLQNLTPPTPECAPSLEGLPVDQLSEALSTKDLLSADVSTKVRVARDDLVQMEQLAANARAAEVRRQASFDRTFLEQQRRTLTSLHEASDAILTHLRE